MNKKTKNAPHFAMLAFILANLAYISYLLPYKYTFGAGIAFGFVALSAIIQFMKAVTRKSFGSRRWRNFIFIFVVNILILLGVNRVLDANSRHNSEVLSNFNENFWGEIIEIDKEHYNKSGNLNNREFKLIYLKLHESGTKSYDKRDSSLSIYAVIKEKKAVVIEYDEKATNVGVSNFYAYDGAKDSAYHFKIVKDSEKHLYQPLHKIDVLPDSMQVYIFNSWQPRYLKNEPNRTFAINQIDSLKL